MPTYTRAIWPPIFLIVVFVVLYGILDFGFWLLGLTNPYASGLSEMPEIKEMHRGILTCAAGVYALYRLWRFHPACNAGYANWLRSSPWTPAQKLPVGPIHPVWQDVVVVGVLMAIAQWHAKTDPMLPLIGFAGVYLAALTGLLVLTRQWSSCLVLGFLWPTLVLPQVTGVLRVIVITALALVIWHGHRTCLQAFPWDFLIRLNKKAGTGSASLLQLEIHVESMNLLGSEGTKVGWPFFALAPVVQAQRVSLPASLSVGALMGWWTFCAVVGFRIEPLPGLILLLAVLAAGIRLLIYTGGILPPFNLLGRIKSGQLVIPGFDKVFIAPMLVVAMAIIGGMVVRWSGTRYALTEALVVTVLCIVLLSGGPTLRDWILTGHHRFRLSPQLTAKKALMRTG